MGGFCGMFRHAASLGIALGARSYNMWKEEGEGGGIDSRKSKGRPLGEAIEKK